MLRTSRSLVPLVTLACALVSGSAWATDVPPFHVYHVPYSVSPLANRDIEFLWSDTYQQWGRPLVPTSGGQNSLDRLGIALCDEYRNPFHFPASDLQLTYDYFSFPDTSRPGLYNTNPASPGFLFFHQNASEGIPDRSHIDAYVYTPHLSHDPNSIFGGVPYEPDNTIPAGCNDTGYIGGTYNCKNYGLTTSPFVASNEDSTTGGAIYHANSFGLPGPIGSQVSDTSWTHNNSGLEAAFCHEFQHAMNAQQPNTIETEMFSAAVEAIVGEDPPAQFVYDVNYTLGLLDAGAPENWRMFTAYLAYNFRGTDTSYTGRTDDLLWRWAHGNNHLFNGLAPRLTDAECAECQTKPYFAGYPSGNDRLQILIQNWRVADYVNNSTLADHQYGFPPQFGFSPSHDIGAWRLNDQLASDDVNTAPPEVMASPSLATRETTFVGTRYSRDGLYSSPMNLNHYGSEYWVIKAGAGLRTADRRLVARVVPLATRSCQFVGRLFVTLVSYQAPVDSLSSYNNLWRHPEWARTVVGPQWMDVDSLRTTLDVTLDGFGQTYNAALVAISLGDGNGSTAYSVPQALPYELAFSARSTPYPATGPVAVSVNPDTSDVMPSWSPAGDEILYSHVIPGNPNTITLFRRRLDGSPAQPLFVPPAGVRIYLGDWSPRGDWVCYDRAENANVPFDIWAYNLSSGEQRHVVNNSDMDYYPSFSPDGQTIAYWRGVNTSVQLRKVGLDGTGDALVASGVGTWGPARWSPDGATLYWINGEDVYSVSASGGTPALRSEFGKAEDVDPHPGNGQPLISDKTLAGCPNITRSGLAVRDLTAQKSNYWYPRSDRVVYHARYSPDGTRAAFEGQRSTGDADIYYAPVTHDHAPAFTGSSIPDLEIPACVQFVWNLSATDPDGEALTYSVTHLPAGATFNGSTHQIRWTPGGDQLGDWYLVYRVMDGSGGLDKHVVRWTVTDQGYCSDPPCPTCYPLTSRTDATDMPTEFSLAENRPNPFSDATTIRLGLPVHSRVSLDIIDVQGRVARRLIDGELAAGWHDVAWDRTTDSGQRVAPGVYFSRMRAGEFVTRRRLVVMP